MADNPQWQRHEKERRSKYVVRRDRPWLRAIKRFDILNALFYLLVVVVAVSAIVCLIYKMYRGVLFE